MFEMSPITTSPARESRAARVDLEGVVVTMIARYPHLVRESHGDRISEGRFTGHAWSALRILRIVGMESEDDEEISTAAEESEGIVAIISESLRAVDSSSSGTEVHNHRLCPCHRDVELGRIALRLGRKVGLPLIDGQYSGTGPSAYAVLRTFFLSPERPHVVFLEFEVLSKRVERSKPGGQVPKVMVELRDEWLSLEEDIAAQGITMDEDGDEGLEGAPFE